MSTTRQAPEDLDDVGPEAPSAADGLDGDVHVSPVKALKAVYAFFYNKRVGLLLILATGLLSLLGVVFPQMPSRAQGDPTGRALWLDQVRPRFGGWTGALDWAGMFSVFSSPLFVTAMALLAISILACTAHRLPLLWQAAFRPHTKVKGSFFTRAKLRDVVVTPLSADKAMQATFDDLHRVRARLLRDESGPGLNLYADRFHLAPFGTAVAHLAMVVIMMGFLISSLTGFRDESFALTVGLPSDVGQGTGLTATAESFEDTYYDTGQPKDYVSELVLHRGGVEVARQHIRVNEPLHFEGIDFHQAYFGVSAVATVVDSTGATLVDGGVPLQWTTADKTRTYGTVVVPDRNLEIVFVAAASGQQVRGIAPGQVAVEVYPIDSDSPLGTATLDPGVPATVADLSVTFEREQQFTGLLVKKDPGALVVWIGCAMLALGTCVTMFLRHHRIWIRVTDAPEGALVQLASPDRADAVFARRFGLITKSIARSIARAEKEAH